MKLYRYFISPYYMLLCGVFVFVVPVSNVFLTYWFVLWFLTIIADICFKAKIHLIDSSFSNDGIVVHASDNYMRVFKEALNNLRSDEVVTLYESSQWSSAPVREYLKCKSVELKFWDSLYSKYTNK